VKAQELPEWLAMRLEQWTCLHTFGWDEEQFLRQGVDYRQMMLKIERIAASIQPDRRRVTTRKAPAGRKMR
jgi:hypothetical protein